MTDSPETEGPQGGPADADLLGRLSAAAGPESRGATTYDGVVARVEQRAARRRTGLSAAGTLATLALVGGGVVALGRGGGAATQSADSAAGSSVRRTTATASGLPHAATGKAASSGALSQANTAATCPSALPATLPAPGPPGADLAGRLVQQAPGASALICSYPLVGPEAAAAPGGSTAALLGQREVAADGSWLARVAGLPAVSDAARAGDGRGCPTTAGLGGTGVYVVRLDYASGGMSWLRVVVGPCGAAVDNGGTLTRQTDQVVADVRAAYEGGAPLR